MSNDAFLPVDYTPPASGGGFTKLESGNTTLRILSNPFMLWVSWTDGKPSRVPFTQPKPTKGRGERDSVKHAWGLIVWNYVTEQIEVFELDKQTVIKSLSDYAQNPKWGHPKYYDIVIGKKGTGKDTEYTLVVEPKTEPSDVIIDAFMDNPVDLTQLLVEGGNPFIDSPAANAAEVIAQSVPTTTTKPSAEAVAAFEPEVETEPAPKKKMPF
jgi:hypothetical protein